MERMRMFPLGDAAFLFSWTEEDGTTRSGIAARAARLRKQGWTGLRDVVPAYRTLAVHLNLRELAGAARRAGRTLAAEIERLAERLYRALEDEADGVPAEAERHIRLRVAYGGENGPDLDACAERSGMSAERFVEAYSSVVYEVAMIGFAPGFPYLSGLPEELAQPRLPSPRKKVPAGSVGIAGGQTGVYPVDSPGGWQLIGRTAERLFRPEAREPFLLAPGDRVSFVPVPAEEIEKPEEREFEPVTASGNVSSFRAEEIGLEVIKPGLLTTVQDAGRFGWLAYGVTEGGAMDSVSMRTANALVGNPEDAAVLEMTLLGAALKLRRDLLCAICGADMEARADGVPLPTDRPVWLRAGTLLEFGRAVRGCRAYLAVAGGIVVPPALGSRSTDARAGLGGFAGRSVAEGDLVPVGPLPRESGRLAAGLKEQADRRAASWQAVSWHAGRIADNAGSATSRTILRLVAGAEWEEFGEEGYRRLLEEEYRVESSSDRMGVRLSGPPIERNRKAELASHGVSPGTMQIPADGRPIILAAGCQPTGGYPKMAHVIGADLPLLAQLRPGDAVRFRPVGLEDAWAAWETTERNLRLLKAGVRHKEGGKS